LSVAGAFHTPFMESAVTELADAAASRPLHDPTHVLYTNRDGSRVDSGAQAMSYMIDQVARPVRWDRCMESFHREGITGMMELAPAGTLAGLAKRALQGVPVVAIKTPDDIEKAQELVNPS
jgi:[acyl-carrier-protein] S-malonyltransferase